MEKLIAKIKGFQVFNLFTVFLRYMIGGAFLYASLPKIFGERFTQISTDDPIGAFFECIYSLPEYWSFLGWSQAIAGFLLITQRFALVGAMAFFAIILNIFFITISLNMRGTPLVVFMMLMATVWLILWDFEKWKYIFVAPATSISAKVEHRPASSIHMLLFGVTGALLLAAGLVFLIWLKMPLLWLGASMVLVLVAAGLSLYFNKNGQHLRI